MRKTAKTLAPALDVSRYTNLVILRPQCQTKAPIQLEQTRWKKLALEVQSLAPKILNAISEQGMTLSLFLDALSWGDESCHSNDRIKFA